MYTPLQISMKLNVGRAMIYKRIKEMNLQPLKKISTSRYYNINEFYDIKVRKYENIWLGKERLLIIRYWIEMKNHKSTIEIALELGIEKYKLKNYIKEFKNNDNCVTIKSKLC